MSSDQPSGEGTDVWALLEVASSQETIAVAPPRPAPTPPLPPTFWQRLRKRAWYAMLDTLGALGWLYVWLKLFVFDVDRALVRHVFPRAEGLLDFRALMFVGCGLLLAAAFWRWKMLGSLAYLLFFPAVVLFWKIPKLIITKKLYRSSFATMFVLNTVAVAGRGLRYHIVSKCLALLAIAAILLSRNSGVLWCAGVAVFGLLIWATVRVVIQTFKASSFIGAQKSLVSLLAKFFESPVTLPETATATGVVSSAEAQNLATRIQLAAIANRGVYLWARQLQKYRESNLTLLFNAVSYGQLFLGATCALFLMNFAALKLDPSQYAFTTHPSGIAMFLYALSGLAMADGGGVTPRGDLAYVLRIFAGLYGPSFTLTAVVNTVLSFRASRDDAELRETVEELRTRARKHEALFQNVLRVGFEEACERLLRLGLGGFVGVMDWINRNIPRDYGIE